MKISRIREETENSYIHWLYDEIEENVKSIGYKYKNLSLLAQENFCIPNGFVIISDAFLPFRDEWQKMLKARSSNSFLSSFNIKSIKEISNGIKNCIRSLKFSDEVEKQIKRGYENLLIKTKKNSIFETPLIVRSSCTVEDGIEYSFAGQFRSISNIRNASALFSAIKEVYASIFEEQTVSYALWHGFNPLEIDMAVIVQEMIRGEWKGIMFTANPITKCRGEIIIETYKDSGESGYKNRSLCTFHIDKSTYKIVDTYFPISGEHQVNREQEEGLFDGDVRRNMSTDGKILELAEIGRRIENLLGTPQDIEWGIRNNNIYVFQSRCITNL